MERCGGGAVLSSDNIVNAADALGGAVLQRHVHSVRLTGKGRDISRLLHLCSSGKLLAKKGIEGKGEFLCEGGTPGAAGEDAEACPAGVGNAGGGYTAHIAHAGVSGSEGVPKIYVAREGVGLVEEHLVQLPGDKR